VLDEPNRPLDDRPRAAIVDDEVGASKIGQRVGKRQDPPHIREPPAIDRLVVVADEEDAVRRRREQQRQPELGAVEVLGFVDEEMGAASAPCGQRARRSLEQSQRARHEVVEVEPARFSDCPLVGHEGPGG
jgi:hypothetical protein